MSFSHPKRVATSLTCTRRSPVRLSHSRAGLHRTHRRLLPSLRPGLRAWAATGRHPARASRHRLRTPDRRGLHGRRRRGDHPAPVLRRSELGGDNAMTCRSRSYRRRSRRKTGDEHHESRCNRPAQAQHLRGRARREYLDGSAGVDRDVLGFGSDWARRRTGAAERDGMDGAGPAARRRQTRLTAGARCCGGVDRRPGRCRCGDEDGRTERNRSRLSPSSGSRGHATRCGLGIPVANQPFCFRPIAGACRG